MTDENAMEQMMLKAIDDAIEFAGGQNRLAALVHVAPPSITGWRLRKKVPAERVLELEEKTHIPRHRFRPDLYPPPSKKS